MSTGSVSTLFDAPVGCHVRIRHLRTSPALTVRLREMGFCEDAVIRCLLKRESNVVCELFHSRVGLGRQVADAIMISTCD